MHTKKCLRCCFRMHLLWLHSIRVVCLQNFYFEIVIMPYEIEGWFLPSISFSCCWFLFVNTYKRRHAHIHWIEITLQWTLESCSVPLATKKLCMNLFALCTKHSHTTYFMFAHTKFSWYSFHYSSFFSLLF